MNILILQLRRIGDLILTTPVIRSLRDKYPDAHITMITHSSGKDILEGAPVDVRLTYTTGSDLALGFLGVGECRWLPELSDRGFDYCLDFTGNDRSAFLTMMSVAKRKVTYARFRKKFLRRFFYTDFIEASVRDLHTADFLCQLLQPLDCALQSVPLALEAPPGRPEILDKAGVKGPYAVLHPGTARAEKYWVAERWAEVARHLAAQGLEIVFTGSLAPDEQAHLQAIKAAAPGRAYNFTGRTNLLELAAVIREARIFCGVDTAAMHLADAMLTPAVALFGPTNPYHWRPRHTRHTIIRSQVEEPFAPGQKGGPMDAIPADRVIAEIDLLLKPENPATL